MNKKCFYVCSYGGSGSKMLCSALNAYGKTEHIHSRKPPNNLEYIGGEWFNGVVIPEEKLKYYYVIYIYRNPSFSIPSRFDNPCHLEHIQIDKSIKLKDVLDSKKDLYMLVVVVYMVIVKNYPKLKIELVVYYLHML